MEKGTVFISTKEYLTLNKKAEAFAYSILCGGEHYRTKSELENEIKNYREQEIRELKREVEQLKIKLKEKKLSWIKRIFKLNN